MMNFLRKLVLRTLPESFSGAQQIQDVVVLVAFSGPRAIDFDFDFSSMDRTYLPSYRFISPIGRLNRGDN
jgi:hypothetical protein